MSSSIVRKSRIARTLPPPRVRKEPPTIIEAVRAAEGLSTDPKEMLEIAAGLMGVSEDEVRPYLPQRPARSISVVSGKRSFVVEHRTARPSLSVRPRRALP